jgi:nucleotide-binding universal stress UspA family protein
MSYKTILVHLNNERRAGPLLEYAATIAEKHGSHIVGLFVFPAFRLTPPLPVPLGRELAGTLRGELREEEKRVRLILDSTTKTRTFPVEWRSVTTDKRPVAEVVLEHARAADLVLASQADPDWGFSDIIDCPDRLAIECGRPVVVLPNAGRFAVPPRVAAVAWNGKREAARALFDALPLLAMAEQVEVLTVDERGRTDQASLPDTEIAAALSRHGIKAQMTRIAAREVSAGHELRTRAADLSADLLVMGAYGHSRLSEFVFGGATRHLLHDMTCPVLFSH